MAQTKTIGVLALQGAVTEHCAAIERCGARAAVVKTAEHIHAVDGLIVPGGESTTVIRLLERFELVTPLTQAIRAGLPTWGTCMGMIVLATDVAETTQKTLGVLDVTVRRNAFGRQSASAETDIAFPQIGEAPFPAIFIRAPWIERSGPGVEILAERDGHGVLVRQGNILGSSFHPELSGDDRLHRYFIAMTGNRKR